MSIVFIEANSTGTTSDAIRLARRRGHQTVLVTMQPEFYATLPDNPLDLCDRVIHSDTYNVAEILRAIRGIDVEAVIAFDDYHLSVAALCAMALGLPHADVRGLVAARYKDVARERTAPVAGAVRAQVVAEGRLGEVDLDALPYPVIVKPVDESSSVAVRLCHRPEQVASAFDDYRHHVVNARDYRPVRALLIEEFVDGEEYSCELYFDRAAGWRVAALTRKFVTPPPHFVEVGHLVPAPVPAALRERVTARVVQWLDAVGLRAGAAHVELRIRDDEAYLIEINPRLPGGHITQLVEWCTGIDLVGRYLDFHLAGGGAPDEREPAFAVAASRFVLPEEVAAEKTNNDVYKCFTELSTFQRGRVQPGDRTVHRSHSNYDRVGYVLLAGSDEETVEADLGLLVQRLKS
ncbi:ATP-grasp domain-containing protein [Micromonospora sp. CPCC 205561]|uniref:ATP-grasp domain-containing protein n=1 Tax=Micromonospora sp. CPCC 205561 TaxID=3122407 RepID=UPI002FF28E14